MKFRRIANAMGAVFRVYSFFLVFPFFASLYWEENSARIAGTAIPLTTATYALVFLFIFLLGYVLSALSSNQHEELREREAYVTVGAGWFFCAVLGALPFLLTRVTRDPVVALFESMSGITTTGFSALPGRLELYPESIHVWRASLHLFGGLGIVLVAVAVIGRLTEGAAKLMSSEAGGEMTRLRPKLTGTAKSLLLVYLGMTLIVFLALWTVMSTTVEGLGWKRGAFEALVHAFGTVATGGMSTRTEGVADFGSDAVSAVILVAMFLGGISFVLHYRALLQPTAYARSVEFRFYFLTFLIATLFVGANLAWRDYGLLFAARNAPFTVLSTLTTTGYLTTDPDLFPDASKIVLLFLMFTGSMVGSTAGSIKAGRIYVLLMLSLREIQKLLHPHAVSVVKYGGRIFPEDSLRRIVVFFFAYLTTFIAGTLGFAALGLDLESSLVASAATLGNVGFGFGAVSSGFSDIHPVGQMLGLLLMWLGRLELFSVFLLFLPATYRD